MGGHGAEGVKPVEMHHDGHKMKPDELEMDSLAVSAVTPWKKRYLTMRNFE